MMLTSDINVKSVRGTAQHIFSSAAALLSNLNAMLLPSIRRTVIGCDHVTYRKGNTGLQTNQLLCFG